MKRILLILIVALCACKKEEVPQPADVRLVMRCDADSCRYAVQFKGDNTINYNGYIKTGTTTLEYDAREGDLFYAMLLNNTQDSAHYSIDYYREGQLRDHCEKNTHSSAGGDVFCEIEDSQPY